MLASLRTLTHLAPYVLSNTDYAFFAIHVISRANAFPSVTSPVALLLLLSTNS